MPPADVGCSTELMSVQVILFRTLRAGAGIRFAAPHALGRRTAVLEDTPSRSHQRVRAPRPKSLNCREGVPKPVPINFALIQRK